MLFCGYLCLVKVVLQIVDYFFKHLTLKVYLRNRPNLLVIDLPFLTKLIPILL